MNTFGIVLAAGQGKRMKSKLYKVLHPVCGKPMVGHVVDTLEHIHTQRTVVITGHGAEAVEAYLQGRAEFALQAQQLGTGHAVMQAKALLGKEEGATIVICGDTPLVTADSLQAMLDLHHQSGAAATVMTAKLDQPHGYGRIVRDESGAVIKIVEQKDCTPEEAQIQEINAGTYCFDNQLLFQSLKQVTNHNAQNEYYLPDVIDILKSGQHVIEAYCAADPNETVGVNDRVALAEAERLMRLRINEMHMRNGVTLIDPAQTYIGPDVEIGADTVIYPGTHLLGKTVIGEQCEIGPNAQLQDMIVGNETKIVQSVLDSSKVGDHTAIGPFAYIRPGSSIGSEVKIGDFVEIKNASLDDGTKVSHLSYVGDAKVGKHVNIGCGAITVNYDGFNKHLTEIEDDAFIGSNVNLVAPVKVGKGAYVVAGSTITQQVPDESMAIARQRQTTKEGYAAKLKDRIKNTKK